MEVTLRQAKLSTGDTEDSPNHRVMGEVKHRQQRGKFTVYNMPFTVHFFRKSAHLELKYFLILLSDIIYYIIILYIQCEGKRQHVNRILVSALDIDVSFPLFSH